MASQPVAIPFPLSTAPGASPQESAGRLIGCYAEKLGDTGPAKVVYRRSAGITAFATTGRTTFRGSLLVNNLLYVALLNRLVTVDTNGVVTDVGVLSGALPVSMARNNLQPTPQIAIVTENGAFYTNGSAAPVAWPDPNLPNANSVFFQDGYFHFTIGDGRVFASGLNATTINSLAFVTIQSRASDSLIRGVPYKGMGFFFKTSSCEIWNDTANPTPAYPYSRLNVIDRGLIGPWAIAGWQDGFGRLMWVADDSGVYMFDASLSPQKVSTEDLDRLIAAVPDKTTLRAGCYVHGAHSFWFLSSPTWTWEFNTNTSQWNERWSYQAGNNTTGAYSLWRGQGGSFAFGKWIVGDQQTGNLGFIDVTNNQEFGQALLMRIESGPVQNFPNRIRIARADFNFVPGVGIAAGINPIQTNPTVMISVSRDNGDTWSNPLARPLGVQGKGNQRVWVLNMGLSGPAGERWRLDITDPVYGAFINATQSADPRAA
jgi:hypothetical protein